MRILRQAHLEAVVVVVVVVGCSYFKKIELHSADYSLNLIAATVRVLDLIATQV